MAELSEAKRKLLEQRLGRKAEPVRSIEPIPSRLPGPAPLAPGQQALLYEHRLRSGDALYNIVHAYRLVGELDTQRLIDAFRLVIERHETLRTTFDSSRTQRTVEDVIEIVETSGSDRSFDDLARAEAHRRFDLENGPLVRVTLMTLGAHDHGLIVAVHHVVSDAASLTNLWAEVSAMYEGAPRAELSTSYSDHVAWQLERTTERDIEFWVDHLGEAPPTIDLGFETIADPEPDGYLTMPVEMSPAALGGGVRPISFFLAVFAAHLQRYDGTSDVTVAMAASTRDHPDVDALIGYFLNVLPLRITVDPAEDPATTAGTVDEILAAALRRRHVPFSTITNAHRRQHPAEDVDLASVMFVYDEPHTPNINGLDITGGIVHTGASVTDLTLFVRPDGNRFEISLEWSGSVYRRTDVERFGEAFVELAEWATRHLNTPWLGSPSEGDQTGPAISTALVPIIERFTHHADIHPETPALRCGKDRWTYAELNNQAKQVASGLAQRGIRAGDRVGIMLPRSSDLIASLLGVQLLGAAYVPVDPNYPHERVKQLLTEASASLTIVEHTTDISLGATTTVRDLLSAEGDRPLLPAVNLDDPAYVIFTSGSTGTPRGVEVDHRRLAASTLGRLDVYDESPSAYLLPSSLGFDSSVAGLFWTLATGGELVLPTEDEVHDVDALTALIEEAAVTHTLMVPSLYRALLDRNAGAMKSLRCAIVAGEACPPSLVERHHHLLPDTSLINEYGPTEATVWATFHRCLPGDVPVPIGLPAPGVRLRIVDQWLRPLPAGASGQLAIGGSGLTDGYLQPSESGARSFVTDPRSGERFYLSGDRVRYNDDGTLFFLGRVDHQIALGGNRIEPEEIERRLLSVDGVRGAVVRAEHQLQDDPIDALSGIDGEIAAALLQRAARSPHPADELLAGLAEAGRSKDLLVAYVEGDTFDAEQLRSVLEDQLPSSMVPDIIEPVDALARTTHGKVDRSALPPAVRRRRPDTQAPPANDGELTTILTATYQRVLDGSDIDANTDFFEAGGDSLQAVEMVLMLEEQLGRRVPISALVAGRTPSALAKLIDSPVVATTSPGERRSSHVVPLRSGGSTAPLIFMPPGGGNLIAFDPLVQGLDPAIRAIGFDLPGADRDDELPTSVEDLATTYMPQLRAAVPRGPYRLVGWSFGGVVALELAQRLVADGEEVELVVMIDTYMPGYQRVGRLRAYQEIFAQQGARGVAAKLARRARRRTIKLATIARGRRAAASGTVLDPTDRDQWLTMKVDAFVERYQPERYDGPVLFFAANGTPTWRTIEPWSALLPDLTVLELEGDHEGPAGLLTGQRALQLAADIADRLR